MKTDGTRVCVCWGFSPLLGMGSAENLITSSWIPSPAWISPLYLLPKLLLLFSPLPAGLWALTQRGVGHGVSYPHLPCPALGGLWHIPWEVGPSLPLIWVPSMFWHTHRDLKASQVPCLPWVGVTGPWRRLFQTLPRSRAAHCSGAGGRGASARGVRICSEAPESALGGMVPGVCEGLCSPCRCLSLGVLLWLLLCPRASSLLLPTFNLF